MTLLASALSILRARWFWSLVGAVILSLLIWRFGDLLALGEARPFASPVARLTAILCIAFAWGAWNLLLQARSRRLNERMVAALAEPAVVAREAPGSAELAEIGRRFAGALEQLRRSRLGRKGSRRWLYQLPWYVMVGPPGSGKSTALAQSGLRLRLGQIQELRGVGGTRYCDWVFTDEAVLIDTAGRYVTQDSDPEADKAAWLGFLDLLKERRPRHPLNGILVVLSTRDLLEGAGGADHAARIRARLEEIEDRLGMRLPVYLLVTKADLVAGFEPFFADLGEAQREHVWGHTFAHRPAEANPPPTAELRQALAGLVARLDRRLPERLAEEPDLGRRAQIFGFPAQVAGLSEEILRFVDRCFRPTTYERGAWLRGVYLTSGAQTGTPIDRLAATVARSIGLAVPPAAAASGERSFFLRHLLEDVVFGEASLAGRDLARERRERWLRGAALAALALVMAGTGAAWAWSFAGNRGRQLETEAELNAWAQQAEPLARSPLTAADADFTEVLPLLDRLRGIADRQDQEEPAGLRMGLSQRGTIGAQLDAAYGSALARLLLPRLVLATERSLRARLLGQADVLDGLKVYLTLAGSAPVDPALLEAFFAREAELRSARSLTSARRHVAALAAVLPGLDARERPTLDARLVGDARAALARLSLPRRAYGALLADAAAAELPPWRVTEQAGPNAALALVRHSRRPLGTAIPGIFTHAGFHRAVLPRLDDVARGTYSEYWVLSGRAMPEAPEPEIRALKADLLRLYYDDAVAQWDGLLRDVTLAPVTPLDQALAVTKALSGPTSPLKLLIQAVVRETALTVPPGPRQPEVAGRTAALNGAAAGRLDGFRRLFPPGSAAAAAPEEVPGAPVEARFAHLRSLVEAVDGAPPALDDALGSLGALHAKLVEIAATPNPREAFARMGPGIADQLGQAARPLPEPARQMLEGVQKGVQAMGRAGARQQLNGAWRTDVLPFCRAATGGRFPFVPGGRADATLDDMARLFGPGGLIEAFVKGPLADFVDTTRQPWGDVQGIGLLPGSLAQLAQARRITAALFAGGSAAKVAFSLAPVSLGATALSATLDVDGQELRYDHGPGRQASFAWPGPSGAYTVRLSFVPAAGGPPVTVVREGPWALFRLLQDGGRFERMGQPDAFLVELGAAGGHALRLRLRAASVENPFDIGVFSRFACPESLVGVQGAGR
jgi:type VI secretion system protein ImpL